MGIRARLRRLEEAAEELGQADLLDVVILCPAADAGGRPPGLHRVGTPGSSAGVWVYDPAERVPRVPDSRLAPWAVILGGDARPDW